MLPDGELTYYELQTQRIQKRRKKEENKVPLLFLRSFLTIIKQTVIFISNSISKISAKCQFFTDFDDSFAFV